MSEKKILFITGIGTDVGKTVVSAIVTQALKADYWKPVQAGDLDNTDSHKITAWCSDDIKVNQEKHRLNTPMSPHGAASIDGVTIEMEDFVPPVSSDTLVVEGAGGMLVPLNDEGFVLADVLEEKKWPVLLVSRHYLGSINHTLLSLEVLKNRNIPVLGIVYVGDENESTEKIISTIGKIPVLARIPMTDKVDANFIQNQAQIMIEQNLVKENLENYFLSI